MKKILKNQRILEQEYYSIMAGMDEVRRGEKSPQDDPLATTLYQEQEQDFLETPNSKFDERQRTRKTKRKTNAY